MKLKYYIIIIAVISLLVGLGAYSILPEDFSLSLATQDGKQFVLPFVILLGIFVGVLFVLGLLFFVIDWLIGRISFFHQQKDLQKLTTQILEQACKNNYTPVVYKNNSFLVLSRILRRFSLTPKIPSQNSGISKLDQMFEVFNQVELGYEQDLKKYQLATDNVFYIQNIINRVKKDYKYGFSVLVDGDFNQETRSRVFFSILDKCNFKEITKILNTSLFLDKSMIFAAIESCKKLQTMLDDKSMIQATKKANFDSLDYVELAKRLKGFYGPDEWLKFFENLTILDDKAELSFLYILCDLEMIAQVEQRLSNLQKSEFPRIRAYIDLRKQGRNYPSELFFV